MKLTAQFLGQHRDLTRRYFLRLGAGGLALAGAVSRAQDAPAAPEPPSPALGPEPYFTSPDKFGDVSRGTPIPHTLSDEKKRQVGLTRETWKLEVIADLDHPVRLHSPLSQATGNALDFAGLLKLAERHAVRFAKVMTCLNIGCPLGMGIWEGVPLREVVWRTGPRDDVRRAYYYGYHNDDPAQTFQSSLPIGRVLEDPFDLPPVVLCYKLNGQWLSAERGGPVRIVVPEAYGFKSIKWLTHVVLSNLAHANDTYANDGNDVDSPLKTFAATIAAPREVPAGERIPLSGYAQVGIGGLSQVQVWINPSGNAWPADDLHFATAPWIDADILPPPAEWGGGLPDERIPAGTQGYDEAGRPRSWPMRLCKAHWAALRPPLPPGEYVLRCRTIDEHGQAQPLPRPFRKSGHAAIEEVHLVVR